MRKRTWVDVGIAVLGLFLVCSAARGVAQAPEGQAGGGTAGQEAGTQPGMMSEVDARQRQEIARLRVEVARLQQELARMQARLAEAGVEPGVGGSGAAGIGAPNAEAPAGATGLGDPAAEGVGGGGSAGRAPQARPDTDNEGTARASIIHTGRVRSVSSQQLVLVGEGGATSALLLARDVRVLRGRQQIPLRNLQAGMFVRATADLYTRDNPVTEIQVLAAEPRAEQE